MCEEVGLRTGKLSRLSRQLVPRGRECHRKPQECLGREQADAWGSPEGFLERVELNPALKEGFHSPNREKEKAFQEGDLHERKPRGLPSSRVLVESLSRGG